MTRARRRDARERRHGLRFARTVDEEVEHGIAWSDYRHTVSKYLLPHPDADAASAAADIRAARAVEIDLDDIEDGTPGEPPSWPHWQGLR